MAGKEAQIRVKEDKSTGGFIVELNASDKKGTRRRKAKTQKEVRTMVNQMKKTLEKEGFKVRVFRGQ